MYFCLVLHVSFLLFVPLSLPAPVLPTITSASEGATSETASAADGTPPSSAPSSPKSSASTENAPLDHKGGRAVAATMSDPESENILVPVKKEFAAEKSRKRRISSVEDESAAAVAGKAGVNLNNNSLSISRGGVNILPNGAGLEGLRQQLSNLEEGQIGEYYRQYSQYWQQQQQQYFNNTQYYQPQQQSHQQEQYHYQQQFQPNNHNSN